MDLCPGRFSKTVKEWQSREINPPSGHWSGIIFRKCLGTPLDLNASVCLLLPVLSPVDLVVRGFGASFFFNCTFGMPSGLPAHLFFSTVCFTNLHCWIILKKNSLCFCFCVSVHLCKKSHYHVELQNSNLLCYSSVNIYSWQGDIWGPSCLAAFRRHYRKYFELSSVSTKNTDLSFKESVQIWGDLPTFFFFLTVTLFYISW